MRDPSHAEQIERWARFVKANPDKWKKPHTQFINAQITKSQKFFQTLASTPNGLQKIKQLKK